MSRLETRKKLAGVIPLVVEGYQNGSTLRELAKIYEVAPGTIRNLLMSEDVDLRARGRKQNPVPDNVDVPNLTEPFPANAGV